MVTAFDESTDIDKLLRCAGSIQEVISFFSRHPGAANKKDRNGCYALHHIASSYIGTMNRKARVVGEKLIVYK